LHIEKDQAARTPRLRLGDLNIDGFPDVLIVVATQGNATSGRIWLGINEEGFINFDPKNAEYSTIFWETEDEVTHKRSISDYSVLSASFFDFDEVGY